jgi:chaperonin cofactor prefoldin
MKLDALKNKISSDEATLKALRDRIKENTTATEKPIAELDRIRADLAALRSEVADLENASPIQLHSKNVSVADAAKRIEELRTKIQRREKQESETAAEIAGLKQQIENDFSSLDNMLEPFVRAVELLKNGELGALLCSVSSDRIDVLYEMMFGRLDRLFPCTVVFGICDGRRRAIRNAKTVADSKTALLWVVDSILADPNPPLAARPAELPDNPNSHLIRAIKETVGGRD